jgi:hypothetical protein
MRVARAGGRIQNGIQAWVGGLTRQSVERASRKA